MSQSTRRTSSYGNRVHQHGLARIPATHATNGLYVTTLDATDTNLLGPLVIDVHIAGVQSVRLYCVVMPVAVYEALYGTTGVLPANTTQWGGTAVASTNVRADVRQVDGTTLSTHSAGYLPADVRQFGGVNGSFQSGRPQVTIVKGSGTMLATREIDTVVNPTNFVLDAPAPIIMAAGDYVRITKIIEEPASTQVAVRRITAVDVDTPLITIDSAASFTVEVGDTVQIFAAPPQLEKTREKLPSKPYLTGTNNATGAPD